MKKMEKLYLGKMKKRYPRILLDLLFFNGEKYAQSVPNVRGLA